MTSTTPRQRTRLIIGGIFLTLLLAAVFTLGSLDAPFQPRTWRDVYRYDKRGQSIGWTRYHPDRAAEEFNHEGLLVVEKDDLGRCRKARTVRYTRAAAKTLTTPAASSGP